MDMKVLAAVFITLFAVAIGMSQGNLEVGELGDKFQGFESSGNLSDLLEQADQSSLNNTVSASLSTPETVEFGAQNPVKLQITTDNTTEFAIGESTASSQAGATITLGGFRGTVENSPGNTSIDGTVKEVSTQALDLSYSSPKTFSTDYIGKELSLQNLERVTLHLPNSTGTVDSGGTTIKLDSENAWFKGFTGNVTFSDSTYDLEGRVASAELGDVNIG
ncbi:MAG: hypothetical protein MUP63_03755 [Candidatus Nanohaloarchaeota archaeon QJJ-7]|nr:hypothetical protein [Candidatus Nanohaloarchaeota archaeon QJJ-7]